VTARATFTDAERRFLTRMRVARLATADAALRPHVIPIVFAIDDRKLYTPVDGKPKRVAPGQLKRVRNLLDNPQVAIVVDEYDEDWTRLAYVQLRGKARIIEAGPEQATAVRLLRQRYEQYKAMEIDEAPVIAVAIEACVTWGAMS